MPENLPAFILVRPQMGENIGAAARAMANFGLKDLRIVAPRDGWPNEAAVANASGALDILKTEVYDTLAEAIADLQQVFATTARRRDMAKEVFTPEGAIKAMGHLKTGFVFGPERTGLENDEIALCHSIISVPVNPDFSSLNLGQSVLLLAYEYMRSVDKTALHSPAHEDPASQDKMEEMMERLMAALEERQFFKSQDLKPNMTRNLRAMILRGHWSEQEVRTFHGVISALIGNKL